MPTTGTKTDIEQEIDQVVVWPASKIMYAYLESNYWRKSGTIGQSCMRHKENQKALNFYIKNNVKIAVIVDKKNKVKSRALLWKNVKIKDKVKPVTYLDRIYYSEESQRLLYKDFAAKNKYKSYDYNSIDYPYIDSIKIEGITHLPYTDTFKWLYYNDLILSKRQHTTKDGTFIELNITTNMGYVWQLDPNNIEEVLTGNRISKKDSIFIKKYNGWVHKNNVVEIDTAYYHRRDHEIVQCGDRTYCLRKDAIREEFTGEWISKKNSIKIKKYSGYVSKNNIICINGEQYHKQDKLVVEYDNSFYFKTACYFDHNVYFPKHRAYILSNILGEKEKEGKLLPIMSQFEWEEYLVKPTKRDILHTPSIVFAAYIPDKGSDIGYIELNTGEFIKDTPENKVYLIHRNGKTYLKHLYKSKTQTERNQLKLAFID